MRAAILSGNIVQRVILLGNLSEYPGAIDGTGADVGDTWTGAAFVKPVKALNAAKQDAKATIIANWAKAERSGVTFAAKVYSSDTEGLARISLYAARARRAKEDAEVFALQVLALDETSTSLNRQELLDLEKAAGDKFKACADYARALRQAVAAATTVADVLAIDLASGWPT